MRRCCDCLLTKAVLEHAWMLVEAAAENHKGPLLSCVVVGSLAAAVYFLKESRRLEEELDALTYGLARAEEENRVLRLRARILGRRRAVVAESARREENSTRRAVGLAARLRKEDCLARAEAGALAGEVRSLWASVLGARRLRDRLNLSLRSFVSPQPSS